MFEGEQPAGSGALPIGDKGKMLSNGDYCKSFELLGKITAPEVTFISSPGHFENGSAAVRGGQPAMANFPDYAVPLTETILLGNLAVWVAATGKGEKVEWDAANQVVENIAGLESIITPTYRPG